jgi:hypothetical protein
MQRITGALILAVLLHANIQAADYNIVPPVTSFTKTDYDAERQNWNIAQDSRGIMYFANTAGLLQYDAHTWQLFRMPNHIGLRSVAIDKNDRIYSGSYEEFGYWESGEDGTLTYHSLSDKLKDYRFNNDEIWRIIILNDKVYFQSFGSYFIYDGNQVIQRSPPEAILFFLKTPHGILAQGMQSGLFSLQNDSLVFIPGSQVMKNALIRAVVQLGPDRILLGTSSKGLYLYEISKNRFTPWKTEADNILINAQINCATMAADSVLCFGTIGSGLVAIDQKGKLLWHFNKDYALPTNTVLYLYTDLQNNIWAALDQGLALVGINSPFRYISAATKNIELVYTAIQFNKSLYIGTNQGAFRLEENSNTFNLLPGTQGQVWQLENMDNQLLCGHNEGTFRIEKDHVVPVSPITGGTSLRPITSGGNNYLIQSTYGWLVVYKKDANGKWTYSHSVKGFSHPVRYLEVDHLGYIWASNFIKDLYRIKLNSDLTEVAEIRTFGQKDGLPSDYKINVAKMGGRVIFCTGSQFYTYDDLKEEMVPYTWLNRMTGEFAGSHEVIPAGGERYWLIKKGKYALVKADQDSLIMLDILPFSLLKNSMIDDNEYIATLEGNKYLFCLENGLAIYEKSGAARPLSFHPTVMIRQVNASSSKNNQFLILATSPRSRAVVPYVFRRITFNLAYPDYSNREISMRCVLDGHHEVVTETISKPMITYYLDAGQYQLTVTALDENNKVLGSTEYYFSVRPPLYLSKVAYLVYLMIICFAGFFAWKGIKNHLRKQNEAIRLEQIKLQQEKLERREQKITALKNEKLEAELRHKSKELASSTMAIIRKNEMLLQIKEEVENQKKKLGNQYPNKYADHLIRMINENISSDDDWEIFQQNFDVIHENFFRHIKSKYPEMTTHDLKMCAFIRLNLSTKEIASLLNITVRGIEAARYRLRKKFGITAEQNLTEFLIELK